MKVLIVEDDLSIQQLLEQFLEARGHEVTTCEDAETGWEAYQKDVYPLLILDWILPGMDGLELCREIRTHPQGDYSVIVVATVRDEPDALETVLDAGADDYLAKPLDINLLNVRLTIAEQQAVHRLRRKAADDALKESLTQIEAAKREWETTAHSLAEIVCLLDDQGRIIRANRTVESWRLAQVEKVEKLGLHQLFHANCQDATCYMEALLREAWVKLSHGQPAESEAYDELLNRHLRVQIRPIQAQTDDEAHETSSFAVAVIYDMTDQKRADEMRAEVLRLRAELQKEYVFDNIIGKSKKMQEMYTLLQQAIESNITVLIQGESGTGKEVVAKAIHFNGSRKSGPFIAVNCAAIPDTLIESELFGHERGAFTGATTRRIGKFEAAEGGTIFLDEIGEMQPLLQVKLLRVLQEREIQRVGGSTNIPINARVMTASNKELDELVKTTKFREDLYYRISVFPIIVPPLRERREDISLLAEHFLKHQTEEVNKSITGISVEVLRLLMGYHWPGNVRELENIIQRATLLETTNTLQANNPAFREINASRESLTMPVIPMQPSAPAELRTLEDIERQAIDHALKSTNNNITHAAQGLGIDRTTLYRKLKKYDMLAKR
jgi:DNA-binding NtrC family response regulator